MSTMMDDLMKELDAYFIDDPVAKHHMRENVKAAHAAGKAEGIAECAFGPEEVLTKSALKAVEKEFAEIVLYWGGELAAYARVDIVFKEWDVWRLGKKRKRMFEHEILAVFDKFALMNPTSEEVDGE